MKLIDPDDLMGVMKSSPRSTVVEEVSINGDMAMMVAGTAEDQEERDHPKTRALFSVTFTTEDGRFQLDGCGDDFDWVPGLSNKPEPYVEIRHYCNSDVGETITLPEFKVFVPKTYELGVIILDRPKP
ncbi:unnamed protein product [Heligmosomoides polygyrus]|uniref:Transthyretin-like family protein n=1 Tax=Heligmosomoides polygyrus TaxID=6339 RepID=A0A3P7WIL1_HELPZ|nr:unnamed protein product [Heligmosomoides polygyrus]